MIVYIKTAGNTASGLCDEIGLSHEVSDLIILIFLFES